MSGTFRRGSRRGGVFLLEFTQFDNHSNEYQHFGPRNRTIANTLLDIDRTIADTCFAGNIYRYLDCYPINSCHRCHELRVLQSYIKRRRHIDRFDYYDSDSPDHGSFNLFLD
jgi:hypothetical protein